MKKIILILVLVFSFNVFSNTLPPTLSNFRIQKNQPSRVYFDSSEEISGSNSKGFIIGSRSISGIKINSGSTSGHYFTVSKAFTFWDNDLIRYEGGSNIQDKGKNPLNDFTLQYIHNNIPEPTGNGNVYYVSTSGNDKSNGLSQINSWRTISYAATKAKAGDVVYIKAGDYGKEKVVIKNSGSNNNPIKFIGYKEKINDDPALKRTVGMNFDSSELPLLKNGNGTAFNSQNKSYVIIRNLQIENYSDYGVDMNNSVYFIIDNVYVKDTHISISAKSDSSTNNRVINSYVANSSKSGIRLQNKNNLIDNTWAVSSRKASMDYYINTYGGKTGTNNTIRNCYVNRFSGDSHSGHGISLKADQHEYGYFLEYNLIENCNIIGSEIELRHRPVKNNVVRYCVLDGNRGISLQDGVSYNIIENTTVKNAKYFALWEETIEDGGMNENGHHNIFKNCVGYNIETLFMLSTYQSKQENIIKNNSFVNCTFHKINKIYAGLVTIDNTNEITNSIFSSAKEMGNGKLNAIQSYNNYYNGFKKVNGVGNISIDPKFEDASKGNYKLKSASKLIDAGKKLTFVKLDFDGSGRPQGSSHDIGAFEYHDDSTPIVKVDAGVDQSICSGESVTLTATGGSSYTWSTEATTASITVNPTSTQIYTVTATDGTSSATDDVEVSVNQVTADAGSDVTIDSGESVTLTASGGDSYLWSNGATTASITVVPTATTDYEVTITKAGCEDLDTVQVTVNDSTPAAVVANAGPDVAICLGESITLIATGGSSYIWSTGATTASIIVNPTSTQTYTVTASDGTSSASDDVVTTVENCEISALENELEARFELYPNPSEGIVNLNITGSEKDLNLVLVSTNGSVVYKDIINTKNTTVTKQVNLHGFTKGIYLVRLFNNDENLVKKLLII